MEINKEELLRDKIINPLTAIRQRIIRFWHENKDEKAISKIIDLIGQSKYDWVKRSINYYSNGTDINISMPIGAMYNDSEQKLYVILSKSDSFNIDFYIKYYDNSIDINNLRIHQNENGYVTIWDINEDFQDVFDIDIDAVMKVYDVIVDISGELNSLINKVGRNQMERLTDVIKQFISIRDMLNKNPKIMSSPEFFDSLDKRIGSRESMIDLCTDTRDNSVSLSIRPSYRIIGDVSRAWIKLKYNEDKNIVESFLLQGQDIDKIIDIEDTACTELKYGTLNYMGFLSEDDEEQYELLAQTAISREDLLRLEGEVKSLKAFVNKQVNMDNNQEYKQKLMAVEPNKSTKPVEPVFDKTKALKGVVVALTEIRNHLNSLAEENYLRKAEGIMPVINNDEEASGLISSDDDNLLSVMLEYGPKETIEITLEHGSRNNCELYIHVRDDFHTILNEFKEIYDMFGTSVMMVCVDNYHNFGITISRKQLEILLSELSIIENRLQDL